MIDRLILLLFIVALLVAAVYTGPGPLTVGLFILVQGVAAYVIAGERR